MADLDDALSLKRTKNGDWAAFADPRYESNHAMFGGWTTAIALGAVINSADGEVKPSAITINFIDRIEPGIELSIHTRRVGGTRSISHWQAEVKPVDSGRTLALASVVLTERRDTDGVTDPTMPEAPDPESLEVLHPPGPKAREQYCGRSLVSPRSKVPRRDLLRGFAR